MSVKGLDAWVERLSRVDMPVLANVVKELNELTGSDEAEVNQLADVILKDANLTSQVLRIANSVQYNPSSFPINTVSRAIVLIGFTGVRAICISVMVIDSLLGKEPRERLLECMALGFHAAAQARNLVKHTNEQAQEEVFIAALLYHLGDMSFWASEVKVADELDALILSEKMSQKQALDTVIGTSFKAITKGLAGIWKLGDTLEQALYPPTSPSPKVTAVLIGEEISRAAKCGWQSDEVTAVINKVAKFCNIEVDQARKITLEMADEAAAVALTYGASQVCHLIPSSKSVDGDKHTRSKRILKTDPQLQLSILRELCNALSEELDINTVFQMVLEGMHRGIGMERVMVGFIQQDQLKARYVLGEGTETWREKFLFPIDKQQDNIFTHAIEAKGPQWINRQPKRLSKHLYSTDMLRVIGCYPAFLSVVSIETRNIALFYADRWNTGGHLDKDQFASFRHFIQQTQMSLLGIVNKGR